MSRKGTDKHLYMLWVDMRNRCNNPNNNAWKYYGGRGIKVCDRWNDYETFVADVGPYPGHGLTLDRSDNNKGYGPDNFEWATRKQQGRNRNYCKLNVGFARFLRLLHGGGASVNGLSRFYGIAPTTLSRAVKGETWS